MEDFLFRVPETGLPLSRKQHSPIGCKRKESIASRSESSSSLDNNAKEKTIPAQGISAINGLSTFAQIKKPASFSVQDSEEIDVVTVEDQNPNDKCLQFDVEVSVAKHQTSFAITDNIESQLPHQRRNSPPFVPLTATPAVVPLNSLHEVVPVNSFADVMPLNSVLEAAPLISVPEIVTPATAVPEIVVPYVTTTVENRIPVASTSIAHSQPCNTVFDKVSIRNPAHLMKLIKSQKRSAPYPLPQPFGTAYELAKEKKNKEMLGKEDAPKGFAGYLADSQRKEKEAKSPQSLADSSTAVSAVNMKIQNRLKAIEAMRLAAGSSSRSSPVSLPPRSANPSPQMAFAGSPHSNASSWASGVVEPAATTSFGSDISSPSNFSLIHQDPLDPLDPSIFTPGADPIGTLPNSLKSDYQGLFTTANDVLSSGFEPYHPAVWNPNDLSDPTFLDF